MNRPDLYRKTVDILYEAYFNDTLEHGCSCGCAVGNLVAAGMGIPIIVNEEPLLFDDFKTSWGLLSPQWHNLFCTNSNGQEVSTDQLADPTIAAQIAVTGYPWQELAKIEFAFETAPKGASKEDYMFNGLVAVLDVLQQLHEVDDNSADVERFETQRVARNSLRPQ